MKLLILLFVAILTLPALAASARQDHAALRHTAEQFLHAQATGLTGTVHINIGSIDPRLNLAPCPAPAASFPAGSRAWGRTTVALHCTAPTVWTIYVPATVQVMGEYIITAVPLASGKKLEDSDVTKATGDLTVLPAGIVTDAIEAKGRILTVALKAGAPLRQDQLRNRQAVQQGQTVQLISGGHGFQVSAEARALTNAAEGQIVQARTAGGQVVSGVARLGGVLEVGL